MTLKKTGNVTAVQCWKYASDDNSKSFEEENINMPQFGTNTKKCPPAWVIKKTKCSTSSQLFDPNMKNIFKVDF